MPDARFFRFLSPLSIAEAVGLVDGVSRSEPADVKRADHVEEVADPSAADLARMVVFVDDRTEAEKIRGRTVGLTLTSAAMANGVEPAGIVCVVKSTRLAFLKIAQALHREHELSPDDPPIHSLAVVHAHARVHPSATVGAGADIGPNVSIAPGAVIGPGVRLGAGTRIGVGASVYHSLIGEDVTIGPGARIGGAGFGFVEGPEGLVRTPQLGRVVIGSRSEIGANTTIDRGALRDTIIGEGVKIDNLVQIGHNVSIGNHSVIAAQTGIAGSTEIGEGVMLGGQVGLADHLKVGSGARVAAGSGVMKDIGPGEKWGGLPARPFATWMREVAALGLLAKRSKTTSNNSKEGGSES